MTDLQSKFESIIAKRDIPIDHAYDVLRAVCFASRKFNEDWHSCVDIHDCLTQESAWTARAFLDAALITLDERDYSFGLKYSHKVAQWGNYLDQSYETCLEVLDMLDDDDSVDEAVVSVINFCSDFAKYDLPEGVERLHLHRHFRGKVDSRFIDFTGKVRSEEEVWDYFVRLCGYALVEILYRTSDTSYIGNKIRCYVDEIPVGFGLRSDHEWIFINYDAKRIADSSVRKLFYCWFWRASDKQPISAYISDKKDYFEKVVLVRRWLLSGLLIPDYFGIAIVENRIERMNIPKDEIPAGISEDDPKN